MTDTYQTRRDDWDLGHVQALQAQRDQLARTIAHQVAHGQPVHVDTITAYRMADEMICDTIGIER